MIFVLCFLTFPGAGLRCKKRALGFLRGSLYKKKRENPSNSPFTGLNLYPKLVWSVRTRACRDTGGRSGVTVTPDVTLLSHQVFALLMYCKSTRAVLRGGGGEMFSCDFIVIFIFSKLHLWILIFVNLGCDLKKCVFFFLFLFFFSFVFHVMLSRSCYKLLRLK